VYRLLIVDDHEVVRLGVRSLVGRNPTCSVCGEASNGKEALEKIAELMPDVVILDLTMPVMNGIDTAEEMHRIAPFIKIILFSMHDMPATVQMLRADAFVAKSSAARDLPVALERVLNTLPDLRFESRN
jgi:two-component system, NarL family, nitrate/nitrite response regulator NarL